MRGSFTSSFRFFLERLTQKGIFGQLLLMASLVALVAVMGGVAAWLATTRFEHASEAIWWAFLRLTDPGYLGDDEGAVLRTISTVVTVLGYVLFMGSLIAIMTQWLSRTLKEYESGVTPIAMKNHVVILGWTNRTPEVTRSLLAARGRLKRFLQSHNVRKLRIAVLLEDPGPERLLEMREYLGEHWNQSQVFLRSGSSLQMDHLARLDLERASVVLIPGADFELGGSEMTDTRVVKTLMTVGSLLRSCPDHARPDVVAEIFDPHKAPIARATIDRKLEVVASNRIISRLLSQAIRHPGLAQVLFGLFSHRQGNSLYLRAAPQLAGNTPRALADSFREAIVLGFLRREEGVTEVIMDPSTSDVLRPDDLLIFLAESHDACQASRPARPEEPPSIRHRPTVDRDGEHSILILGWSHKISALIAELEQSSAGQYDITIMSRGDLGDREYGRKRLDFNGERVRTHNVRGDYTIEAELAAVEPESYDHVVLLASDWSDSSEAADARTILGYALVTSMLKDAEGSPQVLVELLDPDNADLFEERSQEVLVTPRALSHLLAHVALRPELNSVFNELIGVGGSEIDLRPARDFGLVGRDASFTEIQDAVFGQGLAALGVFVAADAPKCAHLNPERDRRWTLTDEDRVVVLATEG